jgi:hypothetical protein
VASESRVSGWGVVDLRRERLVCLGGGMVVGGEWKGSAAAVGGCREGKESVEKGGKRSAACTCWGGGVSL